MGGRVKGKGMSTDETSVDPHELEKCLDACVEICKLESSVPVVFGSGFICPSPFMSLKEYKPIPPDFVEPVAPWLQEIIDDYHS